MRIPTNDKPDGLGIVFSTAALLLEETGYHAYALGRDRALLVAWMLLENAGYRQMTVFWRLRGLFRYFLGRKDWGTMERKGFARPASEAAADASAGDRPATRHP